MARPGRGTNATRWIRILETFSSRLWEVSEVHLVESVLQGYGHRPRHHTVAVLPLPERTGGGAAQSACRNVLSAAVNDSGWSEWTQWVAPLIVTRRVRGNHCSITGWSSSLT